MAFDDDLYALIRRVAHAGDRAVIASGTVVALGAGARVDVQFDASAVAVTVKQLAHVSATVGARVGLVRFGSDWVIVGKF